MNGDKYRKTYKVCKSMSKRMVIVKLWVNECWLYVKQWVNGDKYRKNRKFVNQWLNKWWLLNNE